MSGFQETRNQPAVKTVFYDPFQALSSRNSFDNRIFENAWDAPAAPAVETTVKTNESNKDHGE